MKIAILGTGLAGSSILKALINSGEFEVGRDSIHVFDKRLHEGRGKPYQESVKSMKMNTAARFLSAELDDRYDFDKFLADRYPEWDDGEGLIPRMYYGEYLEEHFAPYYASDLVEKFDFNIVDLAVIDNSHSEFPHAYRLKNETEWSETLYDAIFIAIGHPPYGDYYQLRASKNFIMDPYPVNEKLKDINNSHRVGVIGSGASGLDMLRYFDDEMALDYPMTFYVRSEPFSSTGVRLNDDDIHVTIDDEWISQKLQENQGFIPLDEVVAQIDADFKAYDIDWDTQVREFGSKQFFENIIGHEVQSKATAYVTNYFDQLTVFKPDLYQHFTEHDSERFMEEYAFYFELFRSPVPSGTMERIKQQLMNGKLRIVSGLTDIKELSDGSFMIYINGHEKETTDILVNASGFDNRLSHGDEFLRNLYNKKLIMPKVEGKDVTVTWPKTQIMNTIYGHLPFAYFNGNYIFSTQYGNNNAQLMVKQADRTVNYFIKDMKGI